jgi:hypothetical protein
MIRKRYTPHNQDLYSLFVPIRLGSKTIKTESFGRALLAGPEWPGKRPMAIWSKFARVSPAMRVASAE